MKKLLLLGLVGFLAGGVLAHVQSVQATDAFKKEFEQKYVKKEPGSDAEKALTAAFQKAKCNTCHVGTTKKVRNDYGKALNQFITKKDIKDKDKIQHALDEVAKLKSKPDDATSPTFGELIEQGKLPGGEPTAATATATSGN